MKRYKPILKERRMQDFKAWYNPESDYFLQFSPNGIHNEEAINNLRLTAALAVKKGYYRLVAFSGGELSIQSFKEPTDREFKAAKQIIKDNSTGDFPIVYWDILNQKTYRFSKIGFFMGDSIKDGERV